MSFCKKIWEDVAPLRSAILAQPFLRELADGSLPIASFKHYIVQDSLYLAEYARVLAIAAARAPSTAGQL
jgi:thiaminase/transcriptional activator TenA